MRNFEDIVFMYMNQTHIWEDFQIYIPVPLNLTPKMPFWLFLD